MFSFEIDANVLSSKKKNMNYCHGRQKNMAFEVFFQLNSVIFFNINY